MATPPGFTTMLGLGSSRFARRYSGSRCCFPFLGVLRCFSSPGSLHLPYFIQAGVPPHDGRWVSPFGHPRIEAWSAAPRGFSQPPTSFIGIWRQGIHRWLFIAWKSILQDARARYRILKVRIDACELQRRRDPKTRRHRRPLAGCRRCDRTFKTEQRKDTRLPVALR